MLDTNWKGKLCMRAPSCFDWNVHLKPLALVFAASCWCRERCRKKVSLLHLTSRWSMATVLNCSERPHQVNSECYPILAPFYCTVYGRLAPSTHRIHSAGVRWASRWMREMKKGWKGKKLRGCRAPRWKHRERKRCENKGGTKGKDGRWEETNTEIRREEERAEGNIEGRKNKGTGRISQRCGELVLIRLSMLFLFPSFTLSPPSSASPSSNLFSSTSFLLPCPPFYLSLLFHFSHFNLSPPHFISITCCPKAA